ncbi:hypothetical protein SNE40_013294 [Patella caerulea]|uniref:Uncharacterized protein n=1 Tax=Patella caerulea TaxID=87958 RepID=A0AAN8JHZ3_PATCE
MAFTPLKISIVCSRLNSPIRQRGLSSREMLYLRDQFSHEPITVSNQQLIHDQSHLRSINHPYSSKSKAHGKGTLPLAEHKVGDLVYLYSDYSKKAARGRYIVVSITKN